ncbi:MAG: DNA-processing protein DprA [Eubacteriales bacterium]|nr:DNA-processing protein DprA [Eubacteriales bacterium]
MNKRKVIQLLLTFQQLPGIGSASILDLLKETDLDQIQDYTFEDLQETRVPRIQRGLEKDAITAFSWQAGFDRAERIMDQCGELDIKIITVLDEAYPANLKVIRLHPVLLYVKGNADVINSKKSAAVIGTREPTAYAVKMDESISRQLGKDGYVIISGLAKGCDCHAHLAAVKNGYPTAAILGQGLGTRTYPAENAGLAEEILETGGALVSEYAPYVGVNGRNLVARDAWQAGMSDGVISIETKTKGGSLHAMEHALKYRRPLGILDHKACAEFRNDPGFADIPEAQGLEMFAEKAPDQVYRLFQLGSLEKFEQAMERERRNRLGLEAAPKEDEPKGDTPQQLSLF